MSTDRSWAKEFVKRDWKYRHKFSPGGAKKPIDYHLEIAFRNWEEAYWGHGISISWVFCVFLKYITVSSTPGILFFLLTGEHLRSQVVDNFFSKKSFLIRIIFFVHMNPFFNSSASQKVSLVFTCVKSVFTKEM